MVPDGTTAARAFVDVTLTARKHSDTYERVIQVISR
jgi:hypothetical protein